MTKKLPLISLITPCYNGETHLLPYINGLLSQTYGNVEYIFVNDGSTDKTEEIILSYQKQFEDKGWTFKYIKKENGGQASAINEGLKNVHGEYLCWIDSDDIILPTYMEEMSSFLENNKDCSFCVPKVEHVDEITKNRILIQPKNLPQKMKGYNLFWDIMNNNTSSETIGHSTFIMVRFCDFLKIYPHRTINTIPKVQIPQLVIPLYYNYNMGYIDKILAQYVIRMSSDCHNIINREEKIKDWELAHMLTIQEMKMPDYDKVSAYCSGKQCFYKMMKNKEEQVTYATLSVLGVKVFFIKSGANETNIRLFFFPLITIKKKQYGGGGYIFAG